MRVLLVDAGREWRGGQDQVRLLTRELARSPDLDVRLVTRRAGDLARRVEATGVPVHGVPWTIGLDPRAWWQLRSCLRTFRPDIVHVHDSHALSLVRGALRSGAGARSRPLLIAHRRVDFHVRPGSDWFRVDRVIAVSEAVKRILVADGVRPDHVTVIFDGIDPDEVLAAAATPLDIRSQLGLLPGTPLAVNVAALVGHKDQGTLIRAAELARGDRPELHWAIAGEGERRPALEREIAQRGVGDRVHLLGYVSWADALIRESDVFVMSSTEEGMGSVILHALALGKPVVATAAGGIPEVLPSDSLVPVGDAGALARRVIAALDHPSPVPLAARCTTKSMAQATLALYRSLV